MNLQDLDLVDRVITVRCAKFFKTGLVPIGQKLTGELTSHIERRGLLPMPPGKASPLLRRAAFEDGAIPASSPCFSMCDGPPASNARSANRALRGYMIFATQRPCTVSSHGIAPARTSSDYPQLATYLGHLDIRSTQRYLRMTPELLQAANQRFAQYAMGGDHEG